MMITNRYDHDGEVLTIGVDEIGVHVCSDGVEIIRWDLIPQCLTQTLERVCLEYDKPLCVQPRDDSEPLINPPVCVDWFALIDWRWVAEEMDASLARKMQWVEDHVRQDSPQDQAIQRLMGYGQRN